MTGFHGGARASGATLRQRWRSLGLGFVAGATRSIISEQVRNRDAVVAALTPRGLGADLVAARHRAVYRRLARRAVAHARLGVLLGFTGLAVLCLLWVGIAAHFGDARGAGAAILAGLMGYVLVNSPLLLVLVILTRLPRLATSIGSLHLVAVLATAGLIVYGEVTGTGPVRPLVGNTVGDGFLFYLLVHGSLTTASLCAAFLFGAPVAWYVRRRLWLTDPVGNGLRALFASIALASSDEDFLKVGTRRRIVDRMGVVALVLRRGLWRVVRPPNALARSVLRHRCELAAQVAEMMCVWVVLPAKTTRGDFLDKVCGLVETLLSGRLDELPVEPLRGAIDLQSRFALLAGFVRRIVIGAVPLGALSALGLFGATVPDGIAGPVRTFAWIWFLVALLGALGELRTGRTLFGQALEFFSRITGK
ncbi:hypothetical protein [Saccharothrix syringae]|uniref:Uncharacterized protein n=1 Tax=Saccharothrix syringae TaxID=103733 RepID=A0A5Q0H701_SACSY|nr:hypothetical protein [Saccharothrix syringae]QFZ21620.1 hypothetical protein EKG83_33270 [Saccharothrix syringae]